MAIQFAIPGIQGGFYDGWQVDKDMNRLYFDPQVTQINGQGYVPLTPDSRFADAGTPQSYLKNPTIANALDKMPDAFTQGPDGQWYMSTDAQSKMSDAAGVRDHGWLDKLLTMAPMLIGGAISGAALGGAFPGVNAAGAAIPAGQTGILSQLGISNPLGNLTGASGADAVGGVGTDTLGVGQSTIDLFSKIGESGLTGQDLVNAITGTGGVGQSTIDLFRKIGAAGTTGDDLLKAIGVSGSTSALGRLLSGAATADDYAKLLGSLGSAGLGYLGANQQTNALNNVADKYLALGAPYRAKLASSYEPGFDLMKEPGFANALDVSTKGVLNKLSTSGNVYDNPGAFNQAQNYIMGNVALPQLNTYRSQLGSFGQLGTNTAGTANLGAAQASAGGLDALGYGLSQATGDSNDLYSVLRKYPGLLGQSFSLNRGASL